MSTVLYSPKADVVASDLGDHWALLDLDSSMYFTLNGVGATVWQTIQENPADIDTLVGAVTEVFNVTDDICRPDIDALLKEMSDAGLIEVVADTTDA